MYLKNLILNNFKNYELVEIELSSKINCFVGANGVGKTNILDAVHYLSLAKSFFNSIDIVSIRHGEDYFTIKGEIKRDGDEDHIYCAFQKQKQKIMKRNGKEYKKLSDHIGRYPVVMISPADSSLITEGGEERRKFMNKIISQYDTFYLDSVLQYNKAVLQRNSLLKNFKAANKIDSDMLAVWDTQLIKHGSYIYDTRKKLINELKPVFQEYYSLISSSKEAVKLEYVSHLNECDFEKTLADSLKKDLFLEYTTVGVHKDNLSLEMNGFPIKTIGSQGQQKSYLTALKLAKFDYIKRMSGYSPMLLLDDIFDKLDADRVRQLLSMVAQATFGQIFITDSNKVRVNGIVQELTQEYAIFTAERGEFK